MAVAQLCHEQRRAGFFSKKSERNVKMKTYSEKCAGVVSLLILTGLLAGTCLPVKAQTFDLSHDFGYPNNPAGAWSYGYASTVGGAFTKFTFTMVAPAPNGVPMEVWSLDNQHLPGVYHNDTTNTAIGNGGQ